MAVQALAWAALGASALLVGGVVALVFSLGRRTIGLIMAFGAGVLISAVAYELVQEAVGVAGLGLETAAGLAAGALAFAGGDRVVGSFGGGARKRSHGGQAAGSGLAIVLGTVLDGVPESVVLGIGLIVDQRVSIAVLVAVILSNLAESLAATTGLARAGWRTPAILAMWALVVLVCGLSALAGVAVLVDAAPGVVAFMLAFAAGAILTMLADTMMPEAFEQGGRPVGLLTTLGFGLAFALSTLG